MQVEIIQDFLSDFLPDDVEYLVKIVVSKKYKKLMKFYSNSVYGLCLISLQDCRRLRLKM